MIELLPTKAAFAAGDVVEIEARGVDRPRMLSLWRLGEEVAHAQVTPDRPFAAFGALEPGGYGVESDDGATTALDVLRRPLERLRYGFLSDFAPGRATTGVADNARRLHLNAVQFYDWMYRHADLIPPQPEYADALGRAVSLDSVQCLAAALRDAGSLPLGYAAVYAVGAGELDRWRDEQLLHPDGTPWALGDFLWIVDPSSPRWLDHFGGQLRAAADRVGFAGFHLDQYGWPKHARRRDGGVVDLAAAFVALIEHVRSELPDASLVFNNVNDFPTEATASAPQDATYIEPWAPHDDLGDLAWIACKAAKAAPGRPVVLASYVSPYASGGAGARDALRLELAAAMSHGATCLLFGEEDAVLVDPYYVRHVRLDDEGRQIAKDYLDFAVRYGDLLFDPDAVDVSRTHSGGINEEILVSGVPVSASGKAGALWVRVTQSDARSVVSLVDLRAQTDTQWDTAKEPPGTCRGVSAAFERTRGTRYFCASPTSPRALELIPRRDRWHDVVDLPAFNVWALVWAED